MPLSFLSTLGHDGVQVRRSCSSESAEMLQGSDQDAFRKSGGFQTQREKKSSKKLQFS